MFSAKKASFPLRSMSSADSARGLCPLDSHSSPERRPTRTAAGRCPAPAPMRRALLAGEASYADSGRALPCTRAFAAGTRGLCPLDSRWGYTPDPEMLRISPRLRAGRGLWCVSARFSLLTGPPKGLRAGRLHACIFYGYQNERPLPGKPERALIR